MWILTVLWQSLRMSSPFVISAGQKLYSTKNLAGDHWIYHNSHVDHESLVFDCFTRLLKALILEHFKFHGCWNEYCRSRAEASYVTLEANHDACYQTIIWYRHVPTWKQNGFHLSYVNTINMIGATEPIKAGARPVFCATIFTELFQLTPVEQSNVQLPLFKQSCVVQHWCLVLLLVWLLRCLRSSLGRSSRFLGWSRHVFLHVDTAWNWV